MRWLCYLFMVMIFSSCWLARAYRIRKMNLTDHEKLPSVLIHKPAQSFHFIEGSSNPDYDYLRSYLDSNLLHSQTGAFLVIRNDSIIYEHYFFGLTKESLLPSNSMAKSFTGTLVGIAIDEGKTKSASEPVTNYIPELLRSDSNFKKITIQDLLDMRSGLLFNEGKYDLHDASIRIGLSHNIQKHLLRVKIAEPPGRFKYQSINSQLLGLIVERATKKKLNLYLEEKLWKAIGAEHDATWNIDSRKWKHVYTSAGLNATARDFAKLGRLYLHKGNWEGRQIIEQNWIETISNADTMEKYNGYKNQWWSRPTYRNFSDSLQAISFKEELPHASIRKMGNDFRVSYRTGSFTAIGFLNQSIYVNPQKNLLIIRLGKRWKHPDVNAIQFVHQLSERL